MPRSVVPNSFTPTTISASTTAISRKLSVTKFEASIKNWVMAGVSAPSDAIMPVIEGITITIMMASTTTAIAATKMG